MTQAFVPLALGSLRKAEATGNAHLKAVLPAATEEFQPGALVSAKVEPTIPAAAHKEHGDPKITLERQGDVVTHIRVQCGCGQVIELKCDY